MVSLEERLSAGDALLSAILGPSLVGLTLAIPDADRGLADGAGVQQALVPAEPAQPARWLLPEADLARLGPSVVPASASLPREQAEVPGSSSTEASGQLGLSYASKALSASEDDGTLFAALSPSPVQSRDPQLRSDSSVAKAGEAGPTNGGGEATDAGSGRAPQLEPASRSEPGLAPMPPQASLLPALSAPANGSLIQASHSRLPSSIAVPYGPANPPPAGPLIASADFSPASGAGNVCIDTPLYITFDQAPVLGTSGTIGVHRADGVLADSIDLADPNSFKRYIGGAQSGGVPYPFNYYPVIVTGNTAAIYLHQTLDYGQTYYVTIDPGVFADADGNAFPGVSDPQTWRFSTKDSGPPVGTTALTVAADGTGDFCTVQGAIDFVPQNNTQRVVIDVRPGTYPEIIYVRSNKAFITVDGEDRDRTVIQYANNNNFNGAVSGNFRALFGVDAPDFVLANVTLHNTTPHGGSQAEAFRGNNQRILLNHVSLRSFQDTLLLQGNGFVNDSYIEGDVDFMWGYGTVFFQNSELKAVTSNGYYTQIRNPQGTNGDVFVNCRLTRADDSITGSYLSRIDTNVFPYSQVVYINTAMDAHIRPVGWLLNNATEAPDVEFWEYYSTDLDGTLLDVSQRAPFSRQFSDAEAAFWSDPAHVLGGWVPNLTPPTFQSLTASPNVLWPPNHQLVPVSLTADVTDDGDPAPRTRIVGVASSEPPDDEPDWVITGDLTLKLRAERDGDGPGRIYTIAVESRDAFGNSSLATVTVTVPHHP